MLKSTLKGVPVVGLRGITLSALAAALIIGSVVSVPAAYDGQTTGTPTAGAVTTGSNATGAATTGAATTTGSTGAMKR
jgi:hypothetical protein